MFTEEIYINIYKDCKKFLVWENTRYSAHSVYAMYEFYRY